jgi:hypothetical protein
MNLATLLVCLWVILVCVSQYFLNWIQFGKTGLIVIGVIGFVGAILWFFGGDYPLSKLRRP